MDKNIIKNIFNYSFIIDLFISWIVIICLLLLTDLVNNTFSIAGFLLQAIIVIGLLLLFIIELRRPSDTIFVFLILYIAIGVIIVIGVSIIQLLVTFAYSFNPILIGLIVGGCTPLWGKIAYRLYRIIKDYI